MHPVVPILACDGLGLALLLACGAGRDPLIAGALAMPLGAAVIALVGFAFASTGLPLTAAGCAAAWAVLLALALLAARRDLRRLWPGPAAIAGGLALVALVAARFDVVVLDGRAHDMLLDARVLAGGGELATGSLSASRLATSVHAAFFLFSPRHVPALLPVLAASGLIALALLVARTADHPRRLALGALAALALASSFPVLRSLVTPGSPALAGGMLLAAGGLWYACERAGERRPLPLVAAGLAAFALHAPAFAAAAVLFAAAMAAGTRLSRRALGVRYRLAAAHPALRLLVATALAALAVMIGAGPIAALLAAMPLALLAAVGLAASRDRAHELEPVDPAVTRDDLEALAVAWVAGTALVAGLEWALLNLDAGDQLAGAAQRLRLLPLGFGNLLPYCLVASLIVMTAEIAGRRLAGRLRWHRLAVGAGGALLAVPYGIWLARFTFSGPQAHELAYRPLLVGLAAALIAGSVGAALWFAALRRERPGWRWLVLPGLVLAAAAVLAASRAGLHNEYEPLHQFLGLWSLLFAALAAREIADRVRSAGRPRLVPAIAIAALVATVVSGVVLARAHGDAWLVWGETAASRYVTRRWVFLTPSADVAALGDAVVIKPDLESPETAALRAERARAPAPNIVLFSVDGLRQDRVGAYGRARRRLTPNIDRFAARGVRFTRAFSSFPATQVFNTALLLGRFVDRSARTQQPPSFRRQAITNMLKERDYHVFVKSWFEQSLSNRFDPRPFNFDTYVPKATSPEHLEEPMDEGLARVAAHLDQAHALGRPVFIWIHLLATHPMKGQGFRPHPDFDFGDGQMDRYDSAVAGSDRWLGGIEELVNARLGGDRPTVWVVLADHGANTHTRSRDLFESIVRVPFIVVAPGLAPRVDDHPIDVSLDLAATVVDLAGIAPPPEYDGISLVPLLNGLPAGAMVDRLIPLAYVGDWTGAVYRDFKYVRRKDVMSLFDLAADPGESHNLIGQEFDRAWAMRAIADRELERRLGATEKARVGP